MVRAHTLVHFECEFSFLIADERWLEWLDSKMAVLIHRNDIDPRDYGGKSYQE